VTRDDGAARRSKNVTDEKEIRQNSRNRLSKERTAPPSQPPSFDPG
jgi:hypothetical protein